MNRLALAALLALSACSAGGSSAPRAAPAAGSPAARFARPAKAETPLQRQTRVKQGSEEAARLIRESVPLVEEVNQAAADPSAVDRARRQELRVKAGEAEAMLRDAGAIYRAIELDSAEQEEIANRLRTLADIIAGLRGNARKI
jgi:hypothetical protein